MYGKTMRGALLVAVAAVLAVDTHATPSTWAGNGHTYDVITLDQQMNWDQARLQAEAMGGYLVTITSGAENDFVAGLVTAQGVGDLQRYWLGGHQTDNLNEPDGSWAWVTGEPWSYTNWAVGEPNDGGGRGQDFLHYWPSPGLWDDMEDDRLEMNSFVIEYDVPEPGSLALLGLGLAGLGTYKRRRR